MFGVGFSELVLIGLVLIIFIRPDDLPKFLRSAGRLYGRAKGFYNELIQIKDHILKEIDKAADLEDAKEAAAPAASTDKKPEEAPKEIPEETSPETPPTE